MKILVTGSEGYIGSCLTSFLTRAGHSVTGFDTNFFSEGWFTGGKKRLAATIKKDIRAITVEDVTGFDAIIHLAELSNDPLGHINANLTFDVNHNGTKRLVDVAKKAGVPRFVYSSSCSVYGASDLVSDETSPTNPLTPYAQSKVLNEQYLLANADESFCPVILRNATVYGVSPRIRFDLAVNNLAGLAWTTRIIKMDSDGTPWRPFVHVLDVCKAMMLAACAPSADVYKQILNVGNTRSNYQIKDVAEIIGKVFGVTEVTLNPNGADKRNYRVNFDKITRVLPEFICSYDVESGAKELMKAFEKVSLTQDTFTSHLYTRLKMIEHLKAENKLDDDLYWK